MDYPQVEDPETDVGRGKWKNPQIEFKTSPSSLATLCRTRCSWNTNNKDSEYFWRNLLLHIYKYSIEGSLWHGLQISENFGYLSSACYLWTHPDSTMSSSNTAVYIPSASISLSIAGAWIILIPHCCDHSGKLKLTLFPWNIIQWDIILQRNCDWYIFVSHEKEWDSIMQTWPHGNEISAYIWPCKFNFC